MRKLTHEEFLERFYKKNKNAENIEILGEYINNRTKIKCRCKLDGYEWETTPKNLLNGYGCIKCSGKMQKTHEEFMKDFMEKNKNAENIEILGRYKTNNTKIKCKCRICGNEWEVKPNTLLSMNTGCPRCKYKNHSEKLSKTHEEFIKEIKKINNDIEILGEYKDNKTKIKCRCKLDGFEWKAIPNSLLRNHGCPKCKINKQIKEQSKTHEEFIKEIKKINNDIEILGEYKDNKTKIKVRCKKDNHIWEVVPNSLLRGIGCPKCNASKGEKRITEYLDNRNIGYKTQYRFKNCKFKTQLPFDFYIPSLNLCIEYDGKQHYKIVDYFGGLDGFIDTKIRDTVKNIYCKENNIKLIRIPYWDFDKIEEILDRELEEFLK